MSAMTFPEFHIYGAGVKAIIFVTAKVDSALREQVKYHIST